MRRFNLYEFIIYQVFVTSRTCFCAVELSQFDCLPVRWCTYLPSVTMRNKHRALTKKMNIALQTESTDMVLLCKFVVGCV